MMRTVTWVPAVEASTSSAGVTVEPQLTEGLATFTVTGGGWVSTWTFTSRSVVIPLGSVTERVQTLIVSHMSLAQNVTDGKLTTPPAAEAVVVSGPLSSQLDRVTVRPEHSDVTVPVTAI